MKHRQFAGCPNPVFSLVTGSVRQFAGVRRSSPIQFAVRRPLYKGGELGEVASSRGENR